MGVCPEVYVIIVHVYGYTMYITVHCKKKVSDLLFPAIQRELG
jgi:hypothetical protein